jgi:hypothetical protein
VPLRLGPATLEEARAEVASALSAEKFKGCAAPCLPRLDPALGARGAAVDDGFVYMPSSR